MDLRSRYRASDLPANAHIGVVEIEDPYQPAGRVDQAGILDVEARLEPVRRRDGTVSEGAPAWTPPRRPLLTAIVNLREDAIGRMNARHQIAPVQYAAARSYQQLFETATIGHLPTGNLLRPKVDGGRVPDPISAARMRAAKRLRSIEGTVREWHGHSGLTLVRMVLTGGKSVEACAKECGAASHELRSWGWLFRKCLDCLAKALGLANSTQRPRRVQLNGHGGEPDLSDQSLQAGAGELADPVLRRGRPNGAGA